MAIKVTKVGSDVEFIVPSHYINHPIFGIDLVPVEEEVQAAPNKETKSTKEQPAPDNITKNKE
jgi:hypothetical protein